MHWTDLNWKNSCTTCESALSHRWSSFVSNFFIVLNSSPVYGLAQNFFTAAWWLSQQSSTRASGTGSGPARGCANIVLSRVAGFCCSIIFHSILSGCTESQRDDCNVSWNSKLELCQPLLHIEILWHCFPWLYSLRSVLVIWLFSVLNRTHLGHRISMNRVGIYIYTVSFFWTGTVSSHNTSIADSPMVD